MLFVRWLTTALGSSLQLRSTSVRHYGPAYRLNETAFGNWIIRNVCQTTGQTRGWTSMTADSIRCPRHLLLLCFVVLCQHRSRQNVSRLRVFKAWLWSTDSLDGSTPSNMFHRNVASLGYNVENRICNPWEISINNDLPNDVWYVRSKYSGETCIFVKTIQKIGTWTKKLFYVSSVPANVIFWMFSSLFVKFCSFTI